MKTVNGYSIEELCNENKQIFLNTQEGVQLSIFVENGITFVLLPFGNKIGDPKDHGHLSSGFTVIPK